ncbi:MAG: ATP-binding protein [Caldilineaceae bacterium SB0664_bin_27]|uniref:ATP-binding protein n=1 Tax=Caldilineaceae bacterium SB0664_bin_27 TaxID=2605260 RepID=A0A6B0YRB7_9CHLR|nr:ATP-binding protein [Caldilineaceae bacterium SB0664_bin_27]
MITLVEALNYRCLRYISRPLKPFHVLVGPNASGKTTFLDVVAFLQELVSEGLEAALESRTNNPQDLLFRRNGERFELAVEALIPEGMRKSTARRVLDSVRYEIAIGFDETDRQFEFKAEKLLLKETGKYDTELRSLFPQNLSPPTTLVTPKGKRNVKAVINKVPGGNDNFYSEAYIQSGKGWAPSFRLGTQKSALGNLPEVEKDFPVATWFRELLQSGVQQLVLNSLMIRRPSPPTRVSGFRLDGSNLPWVVAQLREESPERYSEWIAHLQTALTDLVDIRTVERPEDRHCYLVYEYEGDLRVPSWLVSDGTLRLTGLTLPAYLPDLEGIFLIEEPENGIHPRAVATAFDSLSSMYESQVLLATHSLMVLNAAEMDDLLCFAKDKSGATDIVFGSEHPMLQDWQGEVALGTLLASGVLG